MPGVTPEPEKSPASFPVWRAGLQHPPEGSPTENTGSASPVDATTKEGGAHVPQIGPGTAKPINILKNIHRF